MSRPHRKTSTRDRPLSRFRPHVEQLEDRWLPAITALIDYTLDANHFFDTQAKKDVLQLAADTLVNRFADDLLAIEPGGVNSWTAMFRNPATGNPHEIKDLLVPADTIILYAGGRNLDSLGQGGPGSWYGTGTPEFLDIVKARGEAGALGSAGSQTDFGPWGGVISFDTNGPNWHFDPNTAPGRRRHDFFSVALHEVAHVLGIGTSYSWENLKSGNNTLFTGPVSTTVNGGTNPPLDADSEGAHWQEGLTSTINGSGSHEVAMDPTIMMGTRKLFTDLDFAGLDDLGWDVTRPNNPPIVVDDSYGVDEDLTLTVSAANGVLKNDSDVDGDSLTAALVAGPSNGSLTLNADGSFTYTPNAHFNGSDHFTYKAHDGTVDGNTATVTITVNAVNDTPVAVDDTFSSDEDHTLIVNPAQGVLTNDVDADGDSLTAILVSGPSNGSLTWNADGSFTYEPDAHFNGSESFTYKANDGTVDSNTATVTITVNAVNDVPVAIEDSYGVKEGNTLTVNAANGVLANDRDVDGDRLTAALVAGPSNGSLTFYSDGSFTYTPHNDFSGVDTFTYLAHDGTTDSNLSTVTITVNAAGNNAPVAVEDSYGIDEDTPFTVNAANGVLANDRDVDGDPLSAVLMDNVTNGSLTLNPNGSLTYTPNPNFYGTDRFTYKANDGTTDSNTVTATIRVNAVNDPPLAQDDIYTIGENHTLTVNRVQGVLANDSDIDEDPLTTTLVAGPGNGRLTFNTDGSFTYEPNAGFHGFDSFIYRVNDGRGGTNTATVNVRVEEAMPLPSSQHWSYAISGGEGQRRILFYRADGTLITTITPFAHAPGGIRTAVADVTGDGSPDVIAGTGPGLSTQVKIFDGVTFDEMGSFEPFEPGFTGGVFLAAGDLNGDGNADWGVSPDRGGGPRLRIVDGATGEQIADFFAIEDPNFRGGLRVALADLDDDDIADILAAAGFLGGPRLALWNGARIASGDTSGETAKFIPDFFVFEPTLRNGVFIGGGDITGDGFDDLIVGGGPDGGPRVFGLSGHDLVHGTQTQIANFFAGDIENRGGIRVAAKEINDDTHMDIVTGSGTEALGTVHFYDGTTVAADGEPDQIRESLVPFGDFWGGIFVG